MTLLLAVFVWVAPAQDTIRIGVLGDRTGETVAGVYPEVWRQLTAHKPDVILSVGDSIQGEKDSATENQWREWTALTDPWRSFTLLLTPGNHDVWSDASAAAWRKHTKRELHYSYDQGPVHIAVLDNSRTDELSAGELAFLEADLKAHAAQPWKIIVSHRPSWLFDVLGRNKDAGLHRLAKTYGVQYVLAGHIHEMLHFSFDGVEYVSMMSSGGHLRSTHKYEDGWFFGYGLIEITGDKLTFRINEIRAPLMGEGRQTTLDQWLGVGTRR